MRLVKHLLIIEKKEVHPTMKASTFFLGLTTGAIAAAVTVLYSTPKSGNEIRQSMKGARLDWFRELKGKTNDLKESLANLSTEHMPNTVNRFKKSVEQLKDTADPTKRKLEEDLLMIQESLDRLEQSIVTDLKN